MDKLVYLDEKFFRIYSILNIVGDIVISFNEFNKLMNEQKGKPSPLSNFVVEDMRKLYGLVLFEKKHNRIVEADFNAAFDQCMALVESMEENGLYPMGKNSLIYLRKQIRLLLRCWGRLKLPGGINFGY